MIVVMADGPVRRIERRALRASFQCRHASKRWRAFRCSLAWGTAPTFRAGQPCCAKALSASRFQASATANHRPLRSSTFVELPESIAQANQFLKRHFASIGVIIIHDYSDNLEFLPLGYDKRRVFRRSGGGQQWKGETWDRCGWST